MATKNKLPLSHRPFKRAHRYENIEEARRDVGGTGRVSERLAKARMDAQELAKKIKKEREY